jgi:hypothetical protein
MKWYETDGVLLPRGRRCHFACEWDGALKSTQSHKATKEPQLWSETEIALAMHLFQAVT